MDMLQEANNFDFNTPGINLSVMERQLLAIPGKVAKIPITLFDELNCSIPIKICLISFIENTITFKESLLTFYFLNGCSSTAFYGQPGQQAELVITSLGTRVLETKLKMLLLECPPGYVWKNNTKSCQCSITDNHSIYPAIEKCVEDTMRVRIKKWHWVGYDGVGNETEDDLISAHYPHSHNRCHLLPSEASREQLDKFFVAQTEWEFCVADQCIDNHTTLYHSNGFECYQETTSCNYGFIFYIFSEIIPVTILFTVVFIFDLSFTSGRVNSFIFFAQFLVCMQLEEWVSTFDSSRKVITGILLIYKMLNLDFFSIHELSFCLWKGASTLDILAIKYVTIVYSLILVLSSIFVIEKFTFPKCLQRSVLVRTRKKRVGRSVVNGLSSFFVMCYAQCAMVSISILSASMIRGKGNFNFISFRRIVVYHNGEVEYFSSSHLLYAIPAVVFMLTFVIIPPACLIVYPLCYRMLKAARLSESSIKMCCRVLPLEKFRPLFDLVQGCFKEEYRFFAGLFFVYRLMPQIVFAACKSVTYYGIMEMLLILIITVHCLCRPYKVEAYNKIDICLIINLLLINSLSWWKYMLASESLNKPNSRYIYAMSVLQPLLMLLPLVGFLIYGVYFVFKQKAIYLKLSLFLQKQPSQSDCNEADIEMLIDNRRCLESEDDFSTGYIST